MMPPRFFWKLIFHSGPLAGQSLHLPNGDITLGDTPECDVQLALPKAPGQHCVLRVSEQGVRLRMLRVRCRINGGRLKGEEADIPANQRLDLGGANLVLRARAKMRPCRASKAAGTESACSACGELRIPYRRLLMRGKGAS